MDAHLRRLSPWVAVHSVFRYEDDASNVTSDVITTLLLNAPPPPLIQKQAEFPEPWADSHWLRLFIGLFSCFFLGGGRGFPRHPSFDLAFRCSHARHMGPYLRAAGWGGAWVLRRPSFSKP